MEVKDIMKELEGYRFTLTKEKILQNELDTILGPLGFEKEYYLNSKNIIDFYHPELKIGIEVKIKGSGPAIIAQCKRYCSIDKVKELLLVSNKSVSLPEKLEGKDCHFFKLGTAWL